jgi:amidase
MGAYVQEQSSSGSSSGSGVASSVGLTFASLGTETSGSIISPANYNNIVGIKPTVGLTSRHLVVPFSSHQDIVGPVARTVKDAAYLLAAIAGADPKDNYTTAMPFKTVPDYVAACQPSALSGKRIGVLRSLFNSTLSQAPYQSILLAFNEALDTLREAGATIVDDIPLRGLAEFGPWPNDVDVTGIDFVRDLPAYLVQLTVNPHNITSVADLIVFTQRDPREGWPNRDTMSWERALADAENTTAETLWNAYIKGPYLAWPLGISGALRNHSLDALVSPTITAHFLPATLGSPVVTVPLGAMDEDTEVTRDRGGGLAMTAPGMPFGIAFSGERWSEEGLIGIAYAFEQRTMVRRRLVPYLMPGVEVVDVMGKGDMRKG